MTKLMEIIRETINEELANIEEASQAAKDAKAQGLTNMGFGRWGKDGKVTHITNKSGGLEKYSKAGMERKTGLKFSKSTKDAPGTMSAKGRWGVAKMTEPGRVQRATPRRTPDQQRQANEPHDSLQARTSFGKPIERTPIERATDFMADKVLTQFDYGQEVSKEEFLKKTGLNQKTIDRWVSVEDKHKETGWEPSMFSDYGDTVYIHDPKEL